jgi:hypothetical protein
VTSVIVQLSYLFQHAGTLDHRPVPIVVDFHNWVVTSIDLHSNTALILTNSFAHSTAYIKKIFLGVQKSCYSLVN